MSLRRSYHRHFAPADWESRSGALVGLSGVTWETVIGVVLFLVVAIAWLTVVPTRASSRPQSRSR